MTLVRVNGSMTAGRFVGGWIRNLLKTRFLGERPMDAEVETIRNLTRDATPGSMLILAPDVHDRLATNKLLGREAMDLIGRGIDIHVSARLGPGMILLMAAAQIEAPKKGWAKEFLSKSGPQAADKSAPQPPQPVQPPQPAQPKPSQPSKPKSRRRVVDT